MGLCVDENTSHLQNHAVITKQYDSQILEMWK